MSEVKYRGVEFEDGERKLIVPPLSTRQLEELGLHIDEIAKIREEQKDAGFTLGSSFAKMLTEHYVPIVHAALSRNYGDIKVEEVKDFITMENYGELLGALLGQSSRTKVKSTGEAIPAQAPN